MDMKTLGAVATGAAVLAAFGLLIKKNYMDAYKGASEQSFNFISKLESFSPKAFWDYKQWSVGYGSGFNYDTMTKVTKDTVVDQETAKRWLLAEASRNMDTINTYVKVPLNNNQRVALLGFVYNVGDGAFKSSTLLKKINSKAPKQEIINAWSAWKYAGGQVSQGLINRRAKEINLFFS
jgi:lysozyme